MGTYCRETKVVLFKKKELQKDSLPPHPVEFAVDFLKSRFLQ